MAHELPALPYDFGALAPHIDARTMEIHHDKHHAAYVSKLNAALDGTGLESKSIEDLISDLSQVPESKRMAVRNNGGGHLNHSLFWKSMAAPGNGGGGAPGGKLADAIKADLGSFDAFKEAFSNAAATRFGSGWAWLGVCDGKLCVCSTPNQDNPIMKAEVDCPGQPILGLDVWEHAYYLNYQNRRPDYVAAWWNVVNWTEIESRYEKAAG
jgi:superoxide dismutase, Fe-Mn family